MMNQIDLLKKEVKLLKEHNNKLATENANLSFQLSYIRDNVKHQQDLNKVLENIKIAQLQCIDALNQLNNYYEIKYDLDNDNAYNTTNDKLKSAEELIKCLFNQYNELRKSHDYKGLNINDLDEFINDAQRLDVSDEEYDEEYDEDDVSECEQDSYEIEKDLCEIDKDANFCDSTLIENESGQSKDSGFDLTNNSNETNVEKSIDDMIDQDDVKDEETQVNGKNKLKESKRRKKGFDFVRLYKRNGNKYSCVWKDCLFESNYKQNVERHYRVHTGEKPYKCQFNGCKFAAAQAGNLKVHQTRHCHLNSDN